MKSYDLEKLQKDLKATPNDIINDIENKLDAIISSNTPNDEKIELLEKEKLELIKLDDFCKETFKLESEVINLSDEISAHLKEKSLFDTNTHFDYNLDIKNIITKYISYIEVKINNLQDE